MQMHNGERWGNGWAWFSAAIAIFGGVNGCSEVLGIDPWEDPAESSGGTQNTPEDGGVDSGGDTNEDPSQATCANGEKDGIETDVDCGGDACGPCALGKVCATDADCASHYCIQEGVCADNPGDYGCEVESKVIDETCGDCIKNGLESDVDCGGDACRACGAGKACRGDYDCLSVECVSSMCALAAPGKPCEVTSDCATGVCQEGDCWTGFCCSN